MKRIVINDDNLNPNDIEYDVIRVKALIVNDRGEIVLAHNNNTYQFPGGHVEKGEHLEDALEREIGEELGIRVPIPHGPFMMITTFDNNYFGTSDKVCNKIYYYLIHCNEEPNFEHTHYDSLEMMTPFSLYYIKDVDLKRFLEFAINDGTIDKNIGREMLFVVDVYNDTFKDVYNYFED